MLARVVTLRFDPLLEALDEAPVRGVLKAREVLAIRDRLFVRNGVPYLAVWVTYGPQAPRRPGIPKARQSLATVPSRASSRCPRRKS